MSDYSVIHTGSDAIGDFCVLDDGDYRVLAFGDNDEQTKLYKQQPHIAQHTYVQAMLASLLFNQPKSVIILGLGGGALVHALRHYDSGVKITAVELRPLVIAAAKRYFQLPLGKKLNVLNHDAIDFIANVEHKKVDVIYADMYSEKGVDKQQMADEFISNCIARLKQGGMVVFNCWKEHSRDDDFKQRLQQHFTYVYACLTGGGNWVIFASQQDNGFNLATNKTATQALSQKLDFNISRVLTRFNEWK
ncbi:spermidine synthase [Shewanella intestini]|uniref:Spermidine synthase n=1 Tax=Shewanella intestini TaxID=2017544 RepID=A0ABS5I2V8_9GAMM|nr:MULTISPECIES: fused MFS/spermidine synthase [Shewanella]MBR9728355.1 spermidine synthase [Shewanella intestini]MRG36697.1 spermidine synthase [Shewanella sp. XMDDZSB0408]